MEQTAHHQSAKTDLVKVTIIYLKWLISFRWFDIFRHLLMFLHCLWKQSIETLLLRISLQDPKYR